MCYVFTLTGRCFESCRSDHSAAAGTEESNDTAHQAAEDSVNLESVREKAMNEMGMVYESQGKVIHYQSPTSDYVKQYDNIPEDGVLAQSKDVKNKE